jgi:hypothetical protein
MRPIERFQRPTVQAIKRSPTATRGYPSKQSLQRGPGHEHPTDDRAR